MPQSHRPIPSNLGPHFPEYPCSQEPVYLARLQKHEPAPLGHTATVSACIRFVFDQLQPFSGNNEPFGLLASAGFRQNPHQAKQFNRGRL